MTAHLHCNTYIFRSVTCTDVRHLAVSVMSSLLPEETDGLAELMCHNKKVQQDVYNDLKKSSQNVRTSNLLNKVLTRQTITNEDLEPQEYGKRTTFFSCFQTPK